jgi:plastocyanin
MRVLSVIFAVLLFAVGEMPSRGATFFVRMDNFNFTPQNLTVDVGDTVTWTNTVITGHDTFCQGVWASTLLPRRGTFSFTFNVEPKTYNYICTPHVSFGMVGTVTVRPPLNTPPTVNINSPANGRDFQVGEPINLDVTATDTGGIAKVDLLVDGAITQTDTTSPYQFTPLNLTVGTHTILARATDTGNLTAESSVSVNVKFANAAPTVRLTSPTNTAKFNEPAIVVFSAETTGALERVEFLTNGVVMAIDTTSPYSVTNTLNRNAYTIVARAIATDTQVATSEPVEIEVGQHIPEPPVVFVVSPSEGQYVLFASNIVLRAEVTVTDSPVAEVRFATSSEVLGTVLSPGPFTLSTFLPEGTNTVFVIAADIEGRPSKPAQVTFVVQMPATITYRKEIAPRVMRLGFFGSSGLPYIFLYSTNNVNWVPFKTNQLYRRILFFDDPIPPGETMRLYQALLPGEPFN